MLSITLLSGKHALLWKCVIDKSSPKYETIASPSSVKEKLVINLQ